MKTLLRFLLVIACTIIPLSSFAAEKYTVELEMKNGDLIHVFLKFPQKRLFELKLPIQALSPQNLKAFS